MTSAVQQQARARLSEPQRQSPLAVVFLILRAIRGLGIGTLVVIALFVFNSPMPGGALFVVPLLVLVAFAIGLLSWWRYTFMVDGDELRVTKGIVQVERLTVPLDRVQSVSIEQAFLHRLVDLVRASVDTAGSERAEFEIDAIPRPIAEALQTLAAEHVARRSLADSDATEPGGEPAVEVPEQVLVQHTPGRLVRIALAQSPWAGLAFIAPLIAVGDDLGSVAERVFGVELPSIPDDDPQFGLWVVWLILAFFVAATVLSLILQVVREVTTNWDLTLIRTSSGFRRTAGLLSTSTKASSFAKIQGVSTSRTPVQRLVGLQNVRLPTIGAGDLVIPGVDQTQLARIRDLVFAGDETIENPQRRISPAAIFLAVRNATILAIILAAALFSSLGFWSLLAFVIVPIFGLSARRRVRLARWDINDSSIASINQFVNRSTKELVLRKTQAVAVTQTFFERRRNLATVRVKTAEGSLAVGMIPLTVANALRDRAIFVAETDLRQWM